MIHDVEKVRPELQLKAFVDPEIAAGRHIPLDGARSVNQIVRGIAECSERHAIRVANVSSRLCSRRQTPPD